MKHISARFSFAMACFYFACVPMLGFAVKYLQLKGFSNTTVGINLAIGAVLCIVTQSLFGKLLDQHLEMSAKQLVLFNSVLMLTIAFVMLFLRSKFFQYIAVICMIMLFDSLLSVFATWAMEYINAGIYLNYSQAKGIGGIAYATGCLLVGYVINQFGPDSIIIVTIISLVVQIISVTTLKSVQSLVPDGYQEFGNSEGKKNLKDSNNYISFFRRDPIFFLLMISFLMCYISYTSINNFQANVVEQAGGDASMLGISASYASYLEFPAMILFPFLAKKFGYRRILEFSCVFFCVKVFLIMFAHNMFMVFVSQTMQFFSYGFFIPCSAHFVNEVLPKSDKSKGQAALGIFTVGLSGLFASLMSGCMLDHFSITILAGVESAICLVGIIGVFYTCNKMKKSHRC